MRTLKPARSGPDEERATASRWFAGDLPRSEQVSRQRPRVQLFCLPYAGGGAAVFRDWQAALGPDVAVLALRLPGRESRIAENPRFETADVAAAIMSRADRPYGIYGHSMGGRLGFDVVREIRRTGGLLPARLYVGGARAPDVCSPSDLDGLSEVSDEELVRRLADRGSLSPQVLAAPDLVALLLPLLRADFTRVDTYPYTPEEPLPVPIVAFHGRRDTSATEADVRAWARHTSAGFTLHRIDGGHLFVDDAGPALLALLGADLAEIPVRTEPAGAGTGTGRWSS